jgi:uncharacterized protein (DUF1697 family)
VTAPHPDVSSAAARGAAGGRVVALLRGMNIGGNRLSVSELRAAAEEIGWRDARTYLASGNVVGTADGEPATLAGGLRAALTARGLDVPVLVIPGPEFRAVLDGCPFESRQGKDVHAYFCWSDPVLDREALARLAVPTEQMEVRGRVVWLHTPDGFGRSALALRLHHVVTGTDMTARNLNTVRALAELTVSAG